jgi:hypothetical protein
MAILLGVQDLSAGFGARPLCEQVASENAPTVKHDEQVHEPAVLSDPDDGVVRI